MNAHRILAIMMALTLGLGAFVWFQARPEPPRKDAMAEARKKREEMLIAMKHMEGRKVLRRR
jgi:hypothetical protein